MSLSNSEITASIVVHESPAPQLRKALDSLLTDRVGRVYVIDNSADERLRSVTEDYPFCTYRHVENRGFGAGHNIAIREAAGAGSRYHVVLNADVCWDNPAIGPMADFADSNPDVAMMGPKVFYPDGMLQYSCRMIPTPFDLIFKRFCPSFLTRRRMRRYLLADIDHNRAFECSYLLGSFLFFRTQSLMEAGGFDERFFMYPEDIDISRRMTSLGRVLYWPMVSVTHEHAAASRTNGRMLLIHISNMVRYFNKWGWFSDPLRRAANRASLRDMPRTTKPEPGRG